MPLISEKQPDFISWNRALNQNIDIYPKGGNSLKQELWYNIKINILQYRLMKAFLIEGQFLIWVFNIFFESNIKRKYCYDYFEFTRILALCRAYLNRRFLVGLSCSFIQFWHI